MSDVLSSRLFDFVMYMKYNILDEIALNFFFIPFLSLSLSLILQLELRAATTTKTHRLLDWLKIFNCCFCFVLNLKKKNNKT